MSLGKLLVALKHLPGQHDQASHGRGRGGTSKGSKPTEDYGSDKALAILRDKFSERGGYLWLDVKGSDNSDYQLFSNGSRYELYEGKHEYRRGGLGSDYMPTGKMISDNVSEARIGASRRANVSDRPDVRRSTKYDVVVNMNVD